MMIHALAENAPMLRLARSAGATVERSGGDSDAYLKLPADNLSSKLEAFIEDGAAEFDYSIKRQSHNVEEFLATIADLSSQLGKSGKGPTE